MRELRYEQPKPRFTRKPKGYRAKQTAKKRRAEGPVIKRVRARCVERDGYCRICDWELNPDDTHPEDGHPDEGALPYADKWNRGPSEWAHLYSRAKTRNQAPDVRHNTMITAMLCQFHHDRVDGRAHPRIAMVPRTSLGADGPLDIYTI